MTRRYELLGLVMAASLALAAPASAAAPTTGDTAFNAGVRAYSQGNVENAVLDWQAASNFGHVGASWLLANLYDQGKGVPRSEHNAFVYYQRAADGGHPDAALKVANIYHEGSATLGIKRNYARALPLYERAALAARPEAQYQLGKMHAFGEGTNASPSEALRWQLLASKKHYVPSLIELARIYFSGEGVTTDRVEGWMYLSLASQFASPAERDAVSAALSKYAGRMQGSDRDQARKRAEEWIRNNPLPNKTP